MKKHILSFFLLTILLTGCSTNQTVKNQTVPNNADKDTNNAKTDIQQPKINNSQNINEKQENIVATTTKKVVSDEKFNMLTYMNQENNFSIEYLKDWTYKEGKEFNYAFHVFFSKEKSQFGILPQGELDRGLPQSKPEEKKITISNKDAIRRDWKLDNGDILIIINFLDYPTTWNKSNRIDITGQQNEIEIFEKMINSFKFVE